LGAGARGRGRETKREGGGGEGVRFCLSEGGGWDLLYYGALYSVRRSCTAGCVSSNLEGGRRAPKRLGGGGAWRGGLGGERGSKERAQCFREGQSNLWRRLKNARGSSHRGRGGTDIGPRRCRSCCWPIGCKREERCRQNRTISADSHDATWRQDVADESDSCLEMRCHNNRSRTFSPSILL
jgi:hypothetical protein